MKLILYVFCTITFLLDISHSEANNDFTQLTPDHWRVFNSILHNRHTQSAPKMKLSKQQVDRFIVFLNTLKQSTPALLTLQDSLPKTTLELLRSVESRGVPLAEAEKMAEYLVEVPRLYSINNVLAFDENTSHIIGREWREIDYSGEKLNWQTQQQQYQRYGITHFKSLDNLKRFFPVESRLGYFKKIYK